MNSHDEVWDLNDLIPFLRRSLRRKQRPKEIKPYRQKDDFQEALMFLFKIGILALGAINLIETITANVVVTHP
jgi:hypothetical protein